MTISRFVKSSNAMTSPALVAALQSSDIEFKEDDTLRAMIPAVRPTRSDGASRVQSETLGRLNQGVACVARVRNSAALWRHLSGHTH